MRHKKYIFIVIALATMAITLFAETPWQQTSASGVVFEYRVTQDGLNLEGKLIGETTGWVAVGFNPTNVMRNANIVIAYVSGVNAVIRDDWGNSNTSHVSDTSQGGTNDVTLLSGNEAAGVTTIHFTIPLVTSDQYDRPMQIGSTYPVILARGANGADNFTGMHAAAGNGSITLVAPVSTDDPVSSPGSKLQLYSYPNPINPQTTLSYSTPATGEYSLSIYNIRGERVYYSTKMHQKGEHKLVWEASALPSGNYIVSLDGAGGRALRRVTLQK